MPSLATGAVAARLAGAAAAALVALIALLGLALLGLGAPNPTAPGAAALTCDPSSAGRSAIPAALLPLYDTAAARFGLGGRGAFVLAAINEIETDFGRNLGPSSAGAVGWMQFMPVTWATYGLDGDGDGRRDPDDPRDAIPAAARYLRAAGAPADWYAAVFAYNHADWYVRQALALADRYQGACTLAAAPDEGESGGGRLSWPTTVHTITAPFGEQRPGHVHAGIDIGAPAGAPIMAAGAGQVVVREDTATSGGYGNYICLQHSARLRTCYAHLAAIIVALAQRVPRAAVIGICGQTGHAFGPHLHFEVRIGPDWSPVDPLRYLP
jgi:peptidoglycan LD-endopeptidase LytH